MTQATQWFITPMDDNAILELIDNEEATTSGGILLPGIVQEDSTLAKVLIAPRTSYHRNGELKETLLKEGDLVRLPKGKVGTKMPEAPEGKTWLCVPEDSIYYIVKKVRA